MQSGRLVSAEAVAATLVTTSAADSAAAQAHYDDVDLGWAVRWDDRDWEQPAGPIGEFPAADLALQRVEGADLVLLDAIKE